MAVQEQKYGFNVSPEEFEKFHNWTTEIDKEMAQDTIKAAMEGRLPKVTDEDVDVITAKLAHPYELDIVHLPETHEALVRIAHRKPVR